VAVSRVSVPGRQAIVGGNRGPLPLLPGEQIRKRGRRQDGNATVLAYCQQVRIAADEVVTATSHGSLLASLRRQSLHGVAAS